MDEKAIILVAEDDDGHFALIERNVLRCGISNPILRFLDGQAVWDFLQQAKSAGGPYYQRPMLAILDIRMPRLDGIQVLERIKADPVLTKIPVIMLTTTSDKEAVEECQRIGSAYYVVKPVEYEKFVAAIQEMCRFIKGLQPPALFEPL